MQHVMDGCKGEAARQHLVKVRKARVKFGQSVPPALKARRKDAIVPSRKDDEDDEMASGRPPPYIFLRPSKTPKSRRTEHTAEAPGSNGSQSSKQKRSASKVSRSKPELNTPKPKRQSRKVKKIKTEDSPEPELPNPDTAVDPESEYIPSSNSERTKSTNKASGKRSRKSANNTKEESSPTKKAKVVPETVQLTSGSRTRRSDINYAFDGGSDFEDDDEDDKALVFTEVEGQDSYEDVEEQCPGSDEDCIPGQ